MKVNIKNQEERYLESHWKKVREDYITLATSTSQEEEVPLQANFTDEKHWHEATYESMEVIHETMKLSLETTHTTCQISTPCYTCQDKCNLVKSLVLKINKLPLKNKQLKHRSIKKTSLFIWTKIRIDAKMKFYTGINTIVLFNKICRLMQLFLFDIIYFEGAKVCKIL